MRHTGEWTKTLFISLHEPNGTHPKRLWRDVETFLRKLSQYTGTHLHAVRGYETGLNSHEHINLAVPNDELERFWKRYESFKPYKAWSWTKDISVFDPDREADAIRYVLIKHEPVLPDDSPEFYCPRKYHRCRKGKCGHIPSK
jgi:hypothetical protein